MRKIQQWSLALMASLLPFCSYANAPLATAWYTGADLGVIHTEYSYHRSIATSPATHTVFRSEYTRMAARVDMGYGKRIGRRGYVGAELNWQAPTAAHQDMTLSHGVTTIPLYGTVKQNSQLIFSLNPGYYLNQSNLVYARLGTVWASYTLGYRVRSVTHSDTTATHFGGFAGVGLEHSITRCLSWRAEADLEVFDRMFTYNQRSGYSVTRGLLPTNYQLMLGLIYHI